MSFPRYHREEAMAKVRLSLLKYIRKRALHHAGPPPPRDYQTHQFNYIGLSMGKYNLFDIGRYYGMCTHPLHKDKTRYPNCHRLRMITLPVQGQGHRELRLFVGIYCLITQRPWGRSDAGKDPWGAPPPDSINLVEEDEGSVVNEVQGDETVTSEATRSDDWVF